jgi:protein tyrosine phosphatase
MVHKSFSFFFSSSSSDHRLVTIICILLLNPLPFIYAAPTETININSKLLRQKREIYFDNDDLMINKNVFAPKEEIIFEGLLGCKYDFNVCNRNEACFDDDLFGQCWDGEGSLRKAFTLDNGIDGLTDNKLIALEYTIDFLNHYHLDWKDYMTQCILSHILIDHYQLNRDRLISFYSDCLEKDELLDELATNNINRRQINQDYKFRYHDPYVPSSKYENFYPVSSSGIPLFIQYNDQSRLPPLIQDESNGEFYTDDDDDILLQRKPSKIIAEESIMNEPTKLTINTKEGYPGLYETLQINNNKQSLMKFNDQSMANGNPATNNPILNSSDTERYFTVETARGYIVINRDFKDQLEGGNLLQLIAQINSWPAIIFDELKTDRRVLTFHVDENPYQINASNVASSALHNQQIIEKKMGIRIIDSGIGNPNRGAQLSVERQNGLRWTIITLVTCALVLFIMGSFAFLYFIKRNDRIRNKFAELTRIKGLSMNYYQDLCRQRMQEQSGGRISPEIHTIHQTTTTDSRIKRSSESSSSRSSTSSWPEEPVTTVNMDIMTGHLILSYMEDHLRDRHRLESEWQSLCTDETNEEQPSCSIALSESNENKNRYFDCIPYDHTRIQLTNDDYGDYINASKISDSDPKCKYIATQGPMPNTTNAFWQMVWEQGSCVIVALTRPIENGITMCHHYWPVEGSARFNDFEVNLVSEHIWSDDYVVRSFYLKNLQTMETRTVTQFHYLTWDELSNPPSAKSLLDFRRKVNKCFRGRASPIIVHCNDGVGRTGTYILLDIVLNRICKGAREINIAATLEHIRDQRAKMVKTKDQFEFVFVAVAEEVTSLLKALPQ